MKKKELVRLLLYYSDNDTVIISNGKDNYNIESVDGRSYQVVLNIRDNNEDKKRVCK